MAGFEAGHSESSNPARLAVQRKDRRTAARLAGFIGADALGDLDAVEAAASGTSIRTRSIGGCPARLGREPGFQASLSPVDRDHGVVGPSRVQPGERINSALISLSSATRDRTDPAPTFRIFGHGRFR